MLEFERNLRERIKELPFRSPKKDYLKVVLGEIQSAEAKGRLTEEDCYRIVKKLVETNDNNLSLLALEDGRRARFEDENSVFRTLLPQYLSADEVEAKLLEKADAIRGADKDTQAMGVAMSYLKSLKVNVEGNTVKAVVQRMRG